MTASRRLPLPSVADACLVRSNECDCSLFSLDFFGLKVLFDLLLLKFIFIIQTRIDDSDYFDGYFYENRTIQLTTKNSFWLLRVKIVEDQVPNSSRVGVELLSSFISKDRKK
jgi:hypothetical protein